MFGLSKKSGDKKETGQDAADAATLTYGSVTFGEDVVQMKELQMKGICIPNPGEGNIITGQRFHCLVTLGEGKKAPSFMVSCHAVKASEEEVIGKFEDLDDDEKRLIAIHLRKLRTAGAIR
jgi:hypothetical protein